MKPKPDNHKSRIIKALCDCTKYDWKPVVKGKCTLCKQPIKPATTCVFLTKNGGHLYGCYRPPRPRNMSPVTYYKKYGCVDDNFARKTNGRYYCQPSHCSKSWKNKKTRDKHLDMAYAVLMH